MKVSQLFTKTTKNAPANETARNAQLLIQAGFIHKEMAGVYAFLPLGLKVIEKIKAIVREEMNAVGGQELIMTNLQPREKWEVTTRWNDDVVDVWFKTKLKDETEIGLAWSHEEPIIEMLKPFVKSYKDLPVNVYQFQTKLRNELRSKSGIMRGREFLMKDMYTAAIDSSQHDKIYNDIMDAYTRVFERLGLGDDTYVTFASGGSFTKFSHEFQTVCENGEDTIYLHKKKNIAINEEVLDDESLQKLGISRDELEEVKSSEVGNIFNFGTEKSEQMDFAFTNENGEKQFIHLGSYGIGISRVMGVIAEKYADEKGLVWPANIAPATVYLARLSEDKTVVDTTNKLYDDMRKRGIEVLYDDRDVRAGQKFADADLMGIPYRVVVSEKTCQSGKHELKGRTETDNKMLDFDGILEYLAPVGS
jgi:prolyl-tRNA synthetase